MEALTEKKTTKLVTAPASCTGLGATIETDGIVFSAAVPEGQEAQLLLYREGLEEPTDSIPLVWQPFQGMVRSVKVFGIDPKQAAYNFLIDGNVVADPNARLVEGLVPFGDSKNRAPSKVRGRLLSESFSWKEDRSPRIPYEDLILYELHVRGFTMQKNSGVRHKGTFQGVKEKIPYLKELGVNAVLLLPAYEFDEIVRNQVPGAVLPPEGGESLSQNRLNYWGYGKGFYFAPKRSYAASDHPDTEFKSMVRAFHENGMEVLMQFSFPAPVDVTMAADALRFWVREYHVDGFHLLTDRESAEALAKDPFLMGTKLIADYFPTGKIYAGTRLSEEKTLAECNDTFKICARRLLKGDENQLGEFLSCVRRNPHDYGVINYLTGHDGFTLMDLVSYEKKHNEENGEQNRDGSDVNFSWNCGAEGPTRKRSVLRLRMQQMKNAFAMLLLSQGTPLILAGDEFGNSQSGNNNPYCLDNEVSWVDWSRRKPNQELFLFVQQLIEFRKNHRILHMREELTGSDLRSYGYPDISCHGSRAWFGAYDYTSRHVGLMYCGYYAGAEEFLYVAYNFYWENRTLALPYLPEGMHWRLVLSSSGEDAGKEDADSFLERTFEMPPRCVKILLGEKFKQEEQKQDENQDENPV